MAGNKSWREVRGQRPLNEARVETYKRVMDAQERISSLLVEHGVEDALLADALDAAHPAIPDDEELEDVYLTSLTRFVAALGGHLELRAVFPGASVTVLDTQAAGGADR